MRNICLISNYNYAAYLNDCLSSIVSQTKKFDQIIIVDDGSTDDSREIITKFCRNRSYATFIFKKNGGQLSCYNAIIELIQPDDFVFFIDSDDIYPHDYLEKISPYIAKRIADFIFVTPVLFIDGTSPLQSACIGPEKTFTFASTSALTRKIRCYIGAETSCICMKGSLYHSLLPYPYEEDWTTRADDVLIYGASIIGTHKAYIESLGIGYRIHANNKHAGRYISTRERVDRELKLERLFQWFSEKTGVTQRAPLQSVFLELGLIPKVFRSRFLIPSPIRIVLKNVVDFLSVFKLLLLGACGGKRK